MLSSDTSEFPSRCQACRNQLPSSLYPKRGLSGRWVPIPCRKDLIFSSRKPFLLPSSLSSCPSGRVRYSANSETLVSPLSNSMRIAIDTHTLYYTSIPALCQFQQSKEDMLYLFSFWGHLPKASFSPFRDTFQKHLFLLLVSVPKSIKLYAFFVFYGACK